MGSPETSPFGKTHRLFRMPLGGHLAAVILLTASALVVIAIWIGVQATRSDPLPTLVWAGELSDADLMTASPMVLDRLGGGWWWIYATPVDRQALREKGVRLALAMPTPLAQMAGCSIPAPTGQTFRP
jgi:Zn-dependent protease